MFRQFADFLTNSKCNQIILNTSTNESLFKKLKEEINKVNKLSCANLYIFAKNGSGQITLKKMDDFSYNPKHSKNQDSEDFTQEETKVENPEKDVDMDDMKYSIEEIGEEQ